MVKIDHIDFIIEVENKNCTVLKLLQSILNALSLYCMVFYLKSRQLSELASAKKKR